jgi:DNA-binding transcriptional LysR family regulator
MISSLERELSFRLLIRSKHGVRLTEEGAALYPGIERAICQYQAVREKAAEIKGLEFGVIRVGTYSSVTCHWLPHLIAGFLQQYPDVRFVFHQGDYRLISEWIHSGAVDFGFVAPEAVPDLQTEIVKEGEFLAVLPEHHPLAERDRVPIAALAEEPYILIEEGSYSEPMEAFRTAGAAPQVKYTLHDDYAIMTMVEEGLGVSMLAELVLMRTNFRIVCRPVDPPVIRTTAVAYKDRRSLPLASQYFVDYIMQHREELP